MTNPVISPKSGVDEDPKILGFGFYGWIFLVGRDCLAWFEAFHITDGMAQLCMTS